MTGDRDWSIIPGAAVVLVAVPGVWHGAGGGVPPDTPPKLAQRENGGAGEDPPPPPQGA